MNMKTIAASAILATLALTGTASAESKTLCAGNLLKQDSLNACLASIQAVPSSEERFLLLSAARMKMESQRTQALLAAAQGALSQFENK